jgi:hypothetical protein
LLQANKITPDDAQNVQNQADNARAGLDVARSLSKTDLNSAEAKLEATKIVIKALSDYLAKKQGTAITPGAAP